MKIKISSEKLSKPISFLYKLWIKSLRYEIVGFDKVAELKEQRNPVMMGIWHNELFPLIGIKIFKELDLVTMASDSKDGQIITEVLKKLNFKVARGSSSKGGVKAFISMTRMMKKENLMGVITMDGPRGPRHIPKQGVFAIAQRTGTKIIPVRCHMSKSLVFEKSWDKFEVPLPFSKCKVVFGPYHEVTAQKLSEDVLNQESVKLAKLMSDIYPDN